MNILLGNQTLSLLAGSEMWTLTLAKEFVRQGHNVTALGAELGLIATKLEAAGVKCVKDFGDKNGAAPYSFVMEEDAADFDIIICNHYEVTKYLHNQFPEVPIIATVHGILHKDSETGEIWPEHPVTEFKVDQYISVSEEVQELMKTVYNLDSVIIRNPFDLERFKKEGEISDQPKAFLINSNYHDVDSPEVKLIKEVSDHYGATLTAVGVHFAPTFEVEAGIKIADVVVGMGRSVLEGVCMGKIGLVHGRWGTGGIIMPDNVEELRKVNFSGRGNPMMTAQEIIADIDQYYNQATVDYMHNYIKENNDVKVVAQKYLDIAKKLIK